jgi:membrane peptidoglycan carboxypeptidase
MEMTAIKLAHIYSALARPDGKVPAPRLAKDMDAQRDTFQFHIDAYKKWFVDAGMRRVMGPGGTAALSRLQNWSFIGKTGTAQNPHGPDHAWFVGMGGPKDGEPEITVTMFLEFAEHGYLASGYAAEAINFYLDRKYNRPFQMYATPRLRFPRGLPVNWNYSAPIVDPPMPPPSPVASSTTPAAPDVASSAAADSTDAGGSGAGASRQH